MGWPDATYDAAIPTHQDVLGYSAGDRISSPEAIATYLTRLAEAAPAQTRLVEYARSWQGRPLHYLVIGSEANVRRLDDIQAAMQRLADPRGLAAADADALIADLPAIVWLAHGVHGNEISPSEAALVTAHHLLASDSGRALLEETMVVIDPLANPDGRARFVHHYDSLAGLTPQGSTIAAERVEGWPSGRTNHYLIDMNRDWFAQTQPEIVGRVRTFLEYYPLVYVDSHEMGSQRTFYFPPPAMPYNPYFPAAQFSAFDAFGRHTGQRFDEFGFRYFTRETYDAYYPGYGDTWPMLQGSLGMTFEMASPRGLVADLDDGGQLTYADAVQRHFVANVATVETAARERERLLRDFLAFRSDAGTNTDFALPRRGDVGRVDKLARLLSTQGIEVRQLDAEARVCGSTLPAGSYLIQGDQPAGRLASTLLAADSPLDDAFWAEQARREDKGLSKQIYDIVAWSLPALWGLDVERCQIREQLAPIVTEIAPSAYPAPARAGVAYLVPWGSQAAVRALAGALSAGLVLETTDESFTQNGRRFPRGTLVVRRAANDADLHEQILLIAAESGAEILATNSSWVEQGVNFGSDNLHKVPAARIALAWGEPASVYSAGSLRYVVEQKVGYPITPVRTADLSSAYLEQFDVLLLPSGSGYAKGLTQAAQKNLEGWVADGGVLVAVGGALELLTRDALAMLDTLPERRAREDAAEQPEEGEDVPSHTEGTILDGPDALAENVAPLAENPPEVLGAILKSSV
ncbi:MAG: M14 family zinc carboxypeptidase, partial [Pseudomonadota bacterium]